ncbi:MAG: AMP-binding protein [Actinomycetota bacterium]
MDEAFPRQDVRAKLFDEYRRSGKWGTKTFDQVLEEACTKRWPDHSFVVASPVRPATATFREFHERGTRLAGALHALGLAKGDVLAMEMPNWMEACLLYHAAATLGLVVVPIIHIYQAKEVEFILAQSKAKVFVVPDDWRGIDYLTMVEAIRPNLPWLEHVIVVGEKIPEGCLSFDEVEARATSDFPKPSIDPNEPHVLAYTSGTTSDPKGVVHSHNTLLAEVRAIVAASGGGEEDVFLCPNPIGHIAGIYSALIAPFIIGYEKLVLMDGWDPKWALELIQEHKVTNTGGATFFLMTLLNAPEFKEFDTSSVKLFGLGGAGVPPSLVEAADAAGWWSMRSYGCTEHPSVTMGTRDDSLQKRAYTDGRPMIEVEMRIVDDDGNDVAEGEIITRGPDQFLGYMDPAMDAEAFDDEGWFRTGDIGKKDVDGYLVITDRKKDIIIRGGENISARELEEILATHPRVQESAVTWISDTKYGERACAFIISRDGDRVTLAEVQDHFRRNRIAKQKTPERVQMVTEFPRTLSGKVQKYVLRRHIERSQAPFP